MKRKGVVASVAKALDSGAHSVYKGTKKLKVAKKANSAKKAAVYLTKTTGFSAAFLLEMLSIIATVTDVALFDNKALDFLKAKFIELDMSDEKFENWFSKKFKKTKNTIEAYVFWWSCLALFVLTMYGAGVKLFDNDKNNTPNHKPNVTVTRDKEDDEDNESKEDSNSKTTLDRKTIQQLARSDFYEVQPNDTLEKIASLNNTTVEELQKLNRLSNPNKIKNGDKIYIHGTWVRTGDNLWRLADRFNTTIENLMEINGLQDTTVYTGQYLFIRPPKPIVRDRIRLKPKQPDPHKPEGGTGPKPGEPKEPQQFVVVDDPTTGVPIVLPETPEYVIPDIRKQDPEEDKDPVRINTIIDESKLFVIKNGKLIGVDYGYLRSLCVPKDKNGKYRENTKTDRNNKKNPKSKRTKYQWTTQAIDAITEMRFTLQERKDYKQIFRPALMKDEGFEPYPYLLNDGHVTSGGAMTYHYATEPGQALNKSMFWNGGKGTVTRTKTFGQFTPLFMFVGITETYKDSWQQIDMFTADPGQNTHALAAHIVFETDLDFVPINAQVAFDAASFQDGAQAKRAVNGSINKNDKTKLSKDEAQVAEAFSIKTNSRYKKDYETYFGRNDIDFTVGQYAPKSLHYNNSKHFLDKNGDSGEQFNKTYDRWSNRAQRAAFVRLIHHIVYPGNDQFILTEDELELIQSYRDAFEKETWLPYIDNRIKHPTTKKAGARDAEIRLLKVIRHVIPFILAHPKYVYAHPTEISKLLKDWDKNIKEKKFFERAIENLETRAKNYEEGKVNIQQPKQPAVQQQKNDSKQQKKQPAVQQQKKVTPAKQQKKQPAAPQKKKNFNPQPKKKKGSKAQRFQMGKKIIEGRYAAKQINVVNNDKSYS